MDYEKKYKELVFKFNAILNLNTVKESGTISTDDVRKLIPELKESADQRIRKDLIDFLEELSIRGKNTNFDKWSKSDCADWIVWLEKQGEQISDDKVKSKFRVGDWLLHKVITNPPFLITEVHDDFYLTNHNSFIKVGDEYEYRPWTILDASPGNVLCTYECGKAKVVFILKSIPQKNCVFSYYCFYNIMYPSFKIDDGHCCLAPNERDVTPATEAQCDLLFEKMRESGYEWDAKEMNLKRID